MKYHLYIRLEEQTVDYTSIIHEVDTIDSTSPLKGARELILSLYGDEFISTREWLKDAPNEVSKHYDLNNQFIAKGESMFITLLDYKVLTEDELINISHLLYAKHSKELEYQKNEETL